jgi:hypothetical protein
MMMGNVRRFRRFGVAVLIGMAVVLGESMNAGATVLEFAQTGGQQSCGPTSVTGNGTTTWGCAMPSFSNVSPLYPQPDPGVFMMTATTGSTSGLPCSTGTANFAPGNPNVGEYRDELGTLTWTGSIPYADNGQGACVTNYAGLTVPLKVTGTGFYVNMTELCEFYALGPDTPAITAGGPGTISFRVDSGTGCTPSN